MFGSRRLFSFAVMTNNEVTTNTPLRDAALSRGLELVAGVSALVGLAAFFGLHVGFYDVVDPVRQPVSSYALVPFGEIGFAAGALGTAVACGALALRFDGDVLPRRLLLLSAGMYVLVVVCPTDTGVEVSSLSGQVHRYAAGVAFGVMTLLTVVMAVSRGGRSLRFFAGASVLLLVTTIVNTFLPGLADGGAWRGVPQRALLAVHIGFLLWLVISCCRDGLWDGATRGRADWAGGVWEWAEGSERGPGGGLVSCPGACGNRRGAMLA